MSGETSTIGAMGGADPRPAAVTFITTEHFTLQGARAATIAESTGRATMFPGSVSAGLVALGLIATATRSAYKPGLYRVKHKPATAGLPPLRA